MTLHTGSHPITHSLPASADGEKAGWRAWVALAVLALPVLLVSMDNTILNFALPAIARDMQPTAAEQLWIIDAYSLVLAGLLVTMGTLGDRWGRRRLLVWAAVGFTAISVLAVFAPSAEWLIVIRAAMGLFGAALMPSTMSLLRSIFRNRDQRRIAIAVWAGMFSAGGALGPIVGGFLIEHFPWQSVFLVAVPMLVAMLALAPFFVPESSDPAPGRIDPGSIVMSMVALGSIALGIKEASVHGPVWLLAVVVGIAMGYVFVRRQLSLSTPMLDMSLFRRSAFSASVVVNLFCVIALIGFLYFASQHLQLIVGLPPMMAGLVLVPGAIVTILAGLAVTPIAKRVSPRVVIPASLSLTVVAYVLVALAGAADVTVLMVGFALLGAGIGAAETVSGELILAAAPPEKAGAASAVSETAYEMGAVLGTSILGGILTAWYRATLELPAGLPDSLATRANETLADAMNVAHEVGGPLGDAVRQAAGHAFDGGMTITSLIGAALVCAAAIVAGTTLGTRRRRGAR